MPQLIEQALRNEIAELKADNARLRQEVANLKNDLAISKSNEVAATSQCKEAREVARRLWRITHLDGLKESLASDHPWLEE